MEGRDYPKKQRIAGRPPVISDTVGKFIVELHDRGYGYSAITTILGLDHEVFISRSSVQRWIEKKGLKMNSAISLDDVSDQMLLDEVVARMSVRDFLRVSDLLTKLGCPAELVKPIESWDNERLVRRINEANKSGANAPGQYPSIEGHRWPGDCVL